MDACSLPSTGLDGPALAIVLIAVALLAAGIALATARRGRRAVARGLGALVLVGALAAVGIGSAQPASADTGRCVAAPTPTPTPEPTPEPTPTPTPEPLIEVTPETPTAAAQCGAEPLLTVPEQEGLDFVQQRTGDDLTIVATPLPGYVVAPGAQSTFEIDMTPSPYAPWPVAIPDEVTTVLVDGEPPADEGALLAPTDPELVPALQAAEDEGALEYAIDGSDFAYVFTVTVVQRADPLAPYVEVARYEVPAAIPSVLTYDFERAGYVLRYTWDDYDLAFWQVATQAETLRAQWGDSAQAILEQSYVAEGMDLSASYVPGPLCDAVVTNVPITLDLSGGGDAPGMLPDGWRDRLDAALDAVADAAATDAPAADGPEAATPATEAPDAALDVLPAETR